MFALIEKTKEENSAEIMQQIIYSTKTLKPLSIMYLSESESDENTEPAESDTMSKELVIASSKSCGTPVKVDTNKKKIYLDKNILMTAVDADLIDDNKFYVKQK